MSSLYNYRLLLEYKWGFCCCPFVEQEEHYIIESGLVGQDLAHKNRALISRSGLERKESESSSITSI